MHPAACSASSKAAANANAPPAAPSPSPQRRTGPLAPQRRSVRARSVEILDSDPNTVYGLAAAAAGILAGVGIPVFYEMAQKRTVRWRQGAPRAGVTGRGTEGRGGTGGARAAAFAAAAFGRSPALIVHQ